MQMDGDHRPSSGLWVKFGVQIEIPKAGNKWEKENPRQKQDRRSLEKEGSVQQNNANPRHQPFDEADMHKKTVMEVGEP